MKIISPFHDYYDSCAKFGIDKSLIYHRKEREIKDPKFTNITISEIISNGSKSSKYYYFHSDHLEIEKYYVVFCGKVYPVFRIYVSYRNYQYCYSSESFINVISDKNYFADSQGYTPNDKLSSLKHFVEDFYKEPTKRNPRWYSNSLEYRDPLRYYNIDDHYLFKYLNYEKLINKHIELNSPVFVISCSKNRFYDNNHIIVNPSLKDFQFFKVMDSYTTFQEIEMFLSNFMTKEKVVSEVPDIIRLQKHGFDKKISFRKTK